MRGEVRLPIYHSQPPLVLLLHMHVLPVVSNFEALALTPSRYTLSRGTAFSAPLQNVRWAPRGVSALSRKVRYAYLGHARTEDNGVVGVHGIVVT